MSNGALLFLGDAHDLQKGCVFLWFPFEPLISLCGDILEIRYELSFLETLQLLELVVVQNESDQVRHKQNGHTPHEIIVGKINRLNRWKLPALQRGTRLNTVVLEQEVAQVVVAQNGQGGELVVPEADLLQTVQAGAFQVVDADDPVVVQVQLPEVGQVDRRQSPHHQVVLDVDRLDRRQLPRTDLLNRRQGVVLQE